MKVIVLLLVGLFLCFQSKVSNGQNLVPNGDFELFSICPTNGGQIYTCFGWSNCGDSSTTPDYYNYCNTTPVNPLSEGIYQIPHSGNGYVGIITRAPSANYREYFGVDLSQPLTIGTKYFLSFYLTLGKGWTLGSPSNNVGVLLSTSHRSTINPLLISNASLFNVSQIITDTINWTFIDTSFYADSNYTFIALGNFYDDAHTDTLQWHGIGSIFTFGIDDLCLSTDSLQCSLVNSLSLLNMQSSIVFPNPANDVVFIQNNSGAVYNITIFDILGKQVLPSFQRNEQLISISIEDIPSGTYVIKLHNRSTGIDQHFKLQIN